MTPEQLVDMVAKREFIDNEGHINPPRKWEDSPNKEDYRSKAKRAIRVVLQVINDGEVVEIDFDVSNDEYGVIKLKPEFQKWMEK